MIHGLRLLVLLVFFSLSLYAQDKNQIVEGIVREATENSQLERLGYEVTDLIGPRLVGTPEMQKAHDWAVEKYESWGIPARNEQWGEWRGWERGVTHIDLISPRVATLEGTMLAWSPGTNGKPETAGLIILPDLPDSDAFQKWLPEVKGKFVLISMHQPTGRPDYNWEEYATPESYEKMKNEKAEATKAWNSRLEKTGLDRRTLPRALEDAGAAGILMSYWSGGFGVNKIFGAYTREIPTLDLSLEDYGMLYRMVEYGDDPVIRVTAESKDLGKVPTFNTMAEIKGTEKPEEYIILSAHFDSWDGGTGATDNATGTLVMMEAMRILKKIYPNPKRTILAGHWGGEEQGLNGSRAFVEDQPEIVNNIQAVFNQDNGTGRVVNLAGQGFLHAYKYLDKWLAAVPEDIRQHIETHFPGMPGSGGSDFASFVAVGAPAFSLSSLSWSYGTYTWHTNRDTYDKIVFDDVRSNAILTAILTYMASEDPETTSREKREMPLDPETGEPRPWPSQRPLVREGGFD